jgi:ubiquinol oxidase
MCKSTWFERAAISYTRYPAEIDEGRSASVAAPEIARTYEACPRATLADVVLVVRADEAHHDGVAISPLAAPEV